MCEHERHESIAVLEMVGQAARMLEKVSNRDLAAADFKERVERPIGNSIRSATFASSDGMRPASHSFKTMAAVYIFPTLAIELQRVNGQYRAD